MCDTQSSFFDINPNEQIAIGLMAYYFKAFGRLDNAKQEREISMLQDRLYILTSERLKENSKPAAEFPRDTCTKHGWLPEKKTE